jgi:hypothetical protein
VLGKDGKAPAIIGQAGDDQPVVRDEPLGLRRELAAELRGSKASSSDRPMAARHATRSASTALASWAALID